MPALFRWFQLCCPGIFGKRFWIFFCDCCLDRCNQLVIRFAGSICTVCDCNQANVLFFKNRWSKRDIKLLMEMTFPNRQSTAFWKIRSTWALTYTTAQNQKILRAGEILTRRKHNTFRFPTACRQSFRKKISKKHKWPCERMQLEQCRYPFKA